jgi:phosphoadenosine phosphosulfate reductase
MPKTVNIMPKLKPFINMPLADKDAITEVIIERNLRELGKDVVVAWSGGKDSTLVLWKVIKRFPEVPVIFNNTGIEYPETIRFIRKITKLWNLNLIETKPIKSFFQCVEEYGWPKGKSDRKDHHSSKCCVYLKENPARNIYRQLKTKGVFTGITAVENRNRQFKAISHGTCYKLVKEKWKMIHPILYWTEDDVWQYHKKNNIPMNEVYAEGCDRCGCSCCTAFLSWESQLSRMNPKLYQMVKLRKDGQYSMKEMIE